jgi:capsid protein
MNPTKSTTAKAKASSVAASDAIFYADFERPGQVRGISALAHALNNIQDQAEITADVKHGIKMANQVGLVRTMKGGNGPQGFASAVTAQSRSGSTINVEQMREGGMVAQLLENEELSVIHDGRPHPNQMVLLEWLVRDIAWGVGLSPEVLWDLAKQTGPSQRYLMAETQRWIEHEQARLKQACQRFYTYFIAKAVKNGELPPPPRNWWWAEWIPQADLTIDRGREGRLELEQLESGVMSLNDYHARKGRDWESVEMQKAREILRRREIESEMGLDEGALDGFKQKQLDIQEDQNENMVSDSSQEG